MTIFVINHSGLSEAEIFTTGDWIKTECELMKNIRCFENSGPK